MGEVLKLKRKVNNAYTDLRSMVDQKINMVEEKIKEAGIKIVF